MSFLWGFVVGWWASCLIIIVSLALRRLHQPKPLAHRRQYRDCPIPDPTDYDVGMEAAFPRDVHDGSEPD
jgi:hypothetical protein